MEGDGGQFRAVPPDGLFQSTPSVWRETPVLTDNRWSRRNFNPLPPYGGRLMQPIISQHRPHFNPLPPYGGRPKTASFCRTKSDFNPLPPYGGRHTIIIRKRLSILFQSTPSVWRETHSDRIHDGRNSISIHSLRMEGDHANSHIRPPIIVFQSTPSVWRETCPS